MAILDGNVKRVLTRVLGFDGDLAESRAGARAVGSAPPRCCPTRGIEPYTQGLMDLGATLCLARSPQLRGCARCTSVCVARARRPARSATR